MMIVDCSSHGPGSGVRPLLTYEERSLLEMLMNGPQEDRDCIPERVLINSGLARRVDPGLIDITQAGTAFLYPLPVPDVTLVSHPDHHTVGGEFMGHSYRRSECSAVRWFCESHDTQGYWLYATDGSNEWHNVSERAIGRTFHEIYRDVHGLYCPGWKVTPYVRA